MNHDMPMLGGIAAALRWLEELTILISGPFLAVGMVISIVDLMTGGHLMQDTPLLLFTWAVTQAIGIEGQLTGSAFGVRRNLALKKYLQAFGFAILTAALGYVAFLAAQAVTLHESAGYNVNTALNLIGIDSVSWAWQRAGIAVVLVVLSGFMRFVPQKATLEDKKAQLLEALELNPLKTQLDAQNIDRVKGAAGRLFNRQQQPVMGVLAPVTQPFDTQANKTSADSDASPDQDGARGAYITAVSGPNGAYLTAVGGTAQRAVRTRKPKRAPRGSLSWEQAARDAWEPGMSIDQLAAAVPGMGRTAAAHWRGVIKAEERERQKQQLREA